jgi:hypothetical protein
MPIVTYGDILVIITFILPGYMVLYTISIFTDYLHEKDTLERIIHYLLFSFCCYFLSTITLIFAFIVSGDVSYSYIFNSFFDLSIFKDYDIILLIISLIYAPLMGFLLGNYYFKRGYPYKHFKKFTNKKYTPSIYAEIIKDFDKGAWITLYLKDNTIIQGKILDFDRDEEKRDYVASITDAERYFPDTGSIVKLKGEKMVINLKDTHLVEFNK